MSREQEALTTILKIGNVPDAVLETEKGEERLFRASVVGLLSDISLSLAVIADKLTEEEEVTE